MESIVILRSATGAPTRVHEVTLMKYPDTTDPEEIRDYFQSHAEEFRQRCEKEFRDDYPDLATICVFTAQICTVRKYL